MTVYTYALREFGFGTYQVTAPQGFVLDESGSMDMALAMSMVLGSPQQTVQIRGNFGVYTINRVSAVGGDLASRVQSAARLNITVAIPPDFSAIFAQPQREAAEIEALARQLEADVAAEPLEAALPLHNDAPGSSLANWPGPDSTHEAGSNPSASTSNAQSARPFVCGICTNRLKEGKELVRKRGRHCHNAQAAFKRLDQVKRHMIEVHRLQNYQIVEKADSDGKKIFSKKE